MNSLDVWIRVSSYIAVALLLSIAVTGCGGGSSSSPAAPPMEEVSSNGSEPRIQLALTAPASNTLEFSTSSQQEVTVDGQTRTNAVQTVVRRETSLSAIDSNFQIESIPELVSFSPADEQPVELELKRIVNQFDIRGVKAAFKRDDNLVNALLLETLRLPSLTLSHPSTPVGVGAIWNERNNVRSVTSSVVTRVDAITDDSISVSKTLDTGTDVKERFSVTGTMDATYALPSLLMQSATINLTVRFEDNLYVNGVKTMVVDNTVFAQSIKEVSP